MKVCSLCKLEKPVEEFYPHRPNGGYQSACKRCDNRRPRDIRKKVLAKYGLSKDAWQEMFEAQNGMCAITGCGRAATDVDHDHKTGTVRALLCARCNPGLGHFKEDPALLEAAAAYLRRHSSQP